MDPITTPESHNMPTRTASVIPEKKIGERIHVWSVGDAHVHTLSCLPFALSCQ